MRSRICPKIPTPLTRVGENEIKIDQVVIGSCTNGRMEDLEVTAKILEGKQVAKHVRCIIIPSTQQIYLDALHKGWLETFIKAGAVVSTPTCGPCLGRHMGILGKGGARSLPRPTAILSAGWAILNRKSIWQAGGRCGQRHYRVHYRPHKVTSERRDTMNAHGIVHKYGDNVDTDVHYPPPGI